MIKSLLKYFYLNLLIDRISQIICRKHFFNKHEIMNCLCSASCSLEVAALVTAGGIPVLWFSGHQLCFSTHRGLWGRCSTLHSCSWQFPGHHSAALVPWSPASLLYTQRSLWRGSTLHSCSWRDPCTPVPWAPALLFYTQRSLGSLLHST